jgi:hypothetical protein
VAVGEQNTVTAASLEELTWLRRDARTGSWGVRMLPMAVSAYPRQQSSCCGQFGDPRVWRKQAVPVMGEILRGPSLQVTAICVAPRAQSFQVLPLAFYTRKAFQRTSGGKPGRQLAKGVEAAVGKEQATVAGKCERKNKAKYYGGIPSITLPVSGQQHQPGGIA